MLVAALLLVGSVLALLIADVARLTTTRSRATVAADAAALGAAPLTFYPFGPERDPTAAARNLAAANGAELVECVCVVDRSWASREVVVVVAVDADLLLIPDRRLQAAAAAEFRPVLLGSG